ncbi:uncharacterized protein V6R79_003314, partial [Siganus canaliculatus]
MGDAILERGQQQLKDVPRVAVCVLGLTRTRRRESERGGGGRGKKERGASGGLVKERRRKNLD